MKQVRKELGTLLWCCLAGFVFFVQIGPAVAAQGYILVTPVHYPGGHGPSEFEPVLHFEFTDTGPLASFTPIPADQAVHDPHSLAFSRQGELLSKTAMNSMERGVYPGSSSIQMGTLSQTA